jgi:hypothetical protein
MVPAVNSRNDKSYYTRKKKTVKALRVTIGEVKHGESNPGVAARKSISLDALKPVQNLLKVSGDNIAPEVGALKMADGKPRAQSRHKHIACIRNIKTEHD